MDRATFLYTLSLVQLPTYVGGLFLIIAHGGEAVVGVKEFATLRMRSVDLKNASKLPHCGMSSPL